MTSHGLPAPRLRVVPSRRAGVSISRADGTVLLALRGVVDGATAGWLEHVLDDLVEGQGNRTVAVDVRRVAAVDTSVLDLLVWAAQRVATRGGHLVLQGPSPALPV